MELNLFSLRVFLKVVECDGISNAANALLLSQPAVSMQIRSLESYLSVPLFLRKPNGKLVLTEAGKTLHASAEEIAHLANNLLRSMERHTNKALSEMQLGTCYIAGRFLAPLMLTGFRKKTQDRRVILTVTRAQKIFEGIADGNLDIGIVGRKFKKRFFTGTQLFQVPLTIFTAQEKASEEPLKLSLRELRTIPLILREEGAGCRLQFQEFLTKKKERLYHFEIVAESESIEAIKSLVKNGQGFAVLPKFMVQKDIQDGVFSEICLHEGQPMQTFYVFYRKGTLLSQTQQEFLDHILQCADQLRDTLLASADVNGLTFQPFLSCSSS
jgi:LysR family transcriptional regulator, transcriptional activator of the cysJI operon